MAKTAPPILRPTGGAVDQPDPMTDDPTDIQASSSTALQDATDADIPPTDPPLSPDASNAAAADGTGQPRQPAPSPDQPASAPPADPGQADPPRANPAMRVISRMQLDLDTLTGGTRPATYDEVDEAFLHAIRAVTPDRLQEFTAVPEPAPGGFAPADTVSSTAADQDSISDQDRLPEGGDPATRPFTGVDLGSPQAAARLEPAVFVKDQQPDEDTGTDGAPKSGQGGPYRSLISQQDDGLSNPFSGMGDAFVRALVERREKLAQELSDVPSDVTNAAANLMRGSQARDLTPGEYQLVSNAFPGLIDLSNVKIVKGPGLNPDAIAAFKVGGNPAFTEGNTIYINPDAKLRNGTPLYSPSLANDPDRIETLIHEFNHVLQYQRLGFAHFFLRYANDQRKYGLYKYGFDRDIVYQYEKRKTVYANETLEGQSQIAGDYARLQALNAPSTLSKRRDLELRLRGTGIYGF